MPLGSLGDDDVDIVKTALQVLQGVGDMVPGVGGLLSGLAGIALTIIESAHKARHNKDVALEMAVRIGNFVIMMNQSLDDTITLSDDMIRRILDIQQIFSDIKGLLQRQLDHRGLFQLTHRAAAAELKRCELRLHDAWRQFDFENAMSIHRKIEDLPKKLESSIIQPSHTTTEDGMHRLLAIHEIRLERIIGTFIGSTYCVQVSTGHLQGERIIVRNFEKGKTEDLVESGYQAELARLRSLWHPNISQLIGFARPNRRHRFTVLSGGALDYINGLDPVKRFSEVARIADQIWGLRGGFVPMGRRGLAREYWASPPVDVDPSAKLKTPASPWACPFRSRRRSPLTALLQQQKEAAQGEESEDCRRKRHNGYETHDDNDFLMAADVLRPRWMGVEKTTGTIMRKKTRVGNRVLIAGQHDGGRFRGGAGEQNTGLNDKQAK
ncbi:hypothetical protein SISNIDRAFT_471528 [Sistotremastrum niveocremeum HHB9708]|uniref:Protein kinase domain-containing protein n=1 Tax=Sistotremastrum niveocremeum HHB9708 TaxID=1314777 RepID=A0A164MIT3_9AGAM|nr:hypothetical protein SISNIDRAFT_471528 [Sistotremastrum niveocremeum HHB9708]